MDKTWSEHETFALADSLGTFTEAHKFDIQPLYTWKQQEGQWELQGVYKLMVSAQVEKGAQEQTASGATLIDDVDQKEDGIYFEYALPFQVVLAADKVAAGTTPKFHVENTGVQLEQGQLLCEWQACVSYDEAKVETSNYFDDVDVEVEYLESTIEHGDVVASDGNALPPWKESYTLYTIPIKSRHDGT